MNAIYLTADIRTIEQSALTALPPRSLMERAGLAATQFALELLPETQQHKPVLVLAGPGNNGGDALEVAAKLSHAGRPVSILLFAQTDRLPEDAKQALALAQHSPARFRDSSPTGAQALIASSDWALVVDGLFGIGGSRPISGDLQALVATVNRLACPILALDVPSGLNADTGAIVGEEDGGVAICATHTITFIAGKPGLYTLGGRDHSGVVRVASLDIENQHYPTPSCWLNDATCFAQSCKPRRHNSHKGSYGNVAILGGAHGMMGAPLLAARSALQTGAGRVYAVFLDNAPAYDGVQPELMCRKAHEFDTQSATLVVGPGLGQSRAAQDLLSRALLSNLPIVLDADALNLIATEPALQHRTLHRHAPTLITPHPLEAARLLGMTSREVQADRISAARLLAAQFKSTVILKGTGSVIAEPDGNVWINPTGNPALATAGSGDVLAGVSGTLLAQGWPMREAALGACWLHGAAADELVQEGVGPIGLTAGEIIAKVRFLLNRLTGEQG